MAGNVCLQHWGQIDAAQKLRVGSYRFIFDGQCLEEGLFYGDDLPGKIARCSNTTSQPIARIQ